LLETNGLFGLKDGRYNRIPIDFYTATKTGSRLSPNLTKRN